MWEIMAMVPPYNDFKGRLTVNLLWSELKTDKCFFRNELRAHDEDYRRSETDYSSSSTTRSICPPYEEVRVLEIVFSNTWVSSLHIRNFLDVGTQIHSIDHHSPRFVDEKDSLQSHSDCYFLGLSSAVADSRHPSLRIPSSYSFKNKEIALMASVHTYISTVHNYQ